MRVQETICYLGESEEEEMTTHAIPDDSEIVVTGKDMFGANFVEKTHLLNLASEEFSFSLFRPVSENQPVRVSFQADRPPSNDWIEGHFLVSAAM